jgi:hypothetical protein
MRHRFSVAEHFCHSTKACVCLFVALVTSIVSFADSSLVGDRRQSASARLNFSIVIPARMGLGHVAMSQVAKSTLTAPAAAPAGLPELRRIHLPASVMRTAGHDRHTQYLLDHVGRPRADEAPEAVVDGASEWMLRVTAAWP